MMESASDGNETFVDKKYPVRQGTANSGRDYEITITALLCLRCSTDATQDMRLFMNAEGCGDFDDIVLFREDIHGNAITYLIQTKHQEVPKPVKASDYTNKHGNFFLEKFCNSLTQINPFGPLKYEIGYQLRKNENKMFIFFTNRQADDCDVITKLDKTTDEFQLINAGGSIYQLNPSPDLKSVIQTNANHVFLYSNQFQIGEELNAEIIKELRKVISPLTLSQLELSHVHKDFIAFITDQSKGTVTESDLKAQREATYLTKSDVLNYLSELLLRPYIKFKQIMEPVETVDDVKLDVWKDILDNFRMTIVDSDEVVDTFMAVHIYTETYNYQNNDKGQDIWKNNSDAVKDILQIPTFIPLKETDLDCIYKYLWKSQKTPLVLVIRTKKEFENVKCILKIYQGPSKFIILNKSGKTLDIKDIEKESFIMFKDLNRELQQKLLECPIMLHGRKSSNTLAQYLIPKSPEWHKVGLTVKDTVYLLFYKFNIGKTYAPLPSYFIPRSFNNIWLKAGVLYIQDEIFIIKSESASSLKKFCDKHKLDIDESQVYYCFDRKNLLCCISRYRIVQVPPEYQLLQLRRSWPTTKTVHYLMLHGTTNLKWLYSVGSTKNISSFVTTDYFKTTTKDYSFDLEDSIPLLVSADPGLGKSVLIDFLALNGPKDVWIIKVNLSDSEHLAYYTQCADSETEKHLEHFNTKRIGNSKHHKDLSSIAFQHHLKSKSILLLLDAFDEIPTKWQTRAMKLIKSIHDAGYLVCVTTRPVLNIQLEEELQTFAVTLSPFTERDQEHFLLKYFTDQIGDASDSSQIGTFTRTLLEYTKENLKDKDQQYTAVPLHTMLLAEVFVEKCKEALFQREDFDLIHICKKFIERKDEFTCEKIGKFWHDISSEYKAFRTYCALELLFDANNIKELREDLVTQERNSMLIKGDGIIVFKSETEVIFVHRLFAEYLAAEWIAENLNNKHKNTARILIERSFDPSLSFVRKMFDLILARDCPLHIAIINQWVGEATNIIKTDANASEETDNGKRSFLHLVAAWGVQHPASISSKKLDNLRKRVSEDSMIKILHSVADPSSLVNEPDELLNYTPLDYSLKARCLYVADEICSKLQDFDKSICNSSFSTTSFKFYMKTFSYGSLEPILLKQSVVSTLNELASKTVGETELPNSTLHLAAITGKIPSNGVADLVESIDAKDVTQKTALHWASAKGHEDFVSWLLSHGASVHTKDRHSRSPLYYALITTKSNRSKIISLLLNKGAAISSKDDRGKTALHYAVHYNLTDDLKLLLKNSDRKLLLARDNYGNVPIHYAAEKGHVGNIELLLRYGTDVDVGDKCGLTALHWAAANGHISTVQLLLDKKANVHIRDKRFNRTPIILAAENGYLYIVELLVSHGAATSVKDIKKWTALHWAARMGHPTIIQCLLSLGANTEVKDFEFCTPLHWAAHMGNIDCIAVLLDHGANTEAKTSEGLTPLHLAADKGHTHNDVMTFLSSIAIKNRISDHNGLRALKKAYKKGCIIQQRYHHIKKQITNFLE